MHGIGLAVLGLVAFPDAQQDARDWLVVCVAAGCGHRLDQSAVARISVASAMVTAKWIPAFAGMTSIDLAASNRCLAINLHRPAPPIVPLDVPPSTHW